MSLICYWFPRRSLEELSQKELQKLLLHKGLASNFLPSTSAALRFQKLLPLASFATGYSILTSSVELSATFHSSFHLSPELLWTSESSSEAVKLAES